MKLKLILLKLCVISSSLTAYSAARVTSKKLNQITTELGRDVIWEEIKQLMRPDFINVADLLGKNYSNHRTKIERNLTYQYVEPVIRSHSMSALSLGLYSVGSCGEETRTAILLSSLFKIPSAQVIFISQHQSGNHAFFNF